MLKLLANFNASRTQKRNLILAVSAVIVGLVALSAVLGDAGPSTPAALKPEQKLEPSFQESESIAVLNTQNLELKSLKEQIDALQKVVANNERLHSEALEAERLEFARQADLLRVNASTSLAHSNTNINKVSFTYHKPMAHKSNKLSARDFVPAGTFARAVVLGGADADAGVTGQTNNNAVMLFKLMDNGRLPNQKASRLKGCFVTGSSYGDISSERAYVILDKLSCAFNSNDIIEKKVTGWAFFAGKVGIKGVPLMRDSKIVTAAGISGALSGIADAAQYARSVQSINPLGSATSVPSGNIAGYSAYGGASKAAETLSDYYVKRAEQYHPVIQVGAGNYVTIVFKDGFYLKADIDISDNAGGNNSTATSSGAKSSAGADVDFQIPDEILGQIRHEPGARA